MGMDKKENIRSPNRLSNDEIERIQNNIQTYQEDEKNELERLNSKNLLESFCFNKKQEYDLNYDKLTIVIIEACDNTLKWIDANQMAGKDLFDRKLKEVSEICERISNLQNPTKQFSSESIPIELYCVNMMNILLNEKICELISENDQQRMKSECEKTLIWLNINKYGERQLFERKLVELKKSCLFNFIFK
jgi:hypothetical protein